MEHLSLDTRPNGEIENQSINALQKTPDQTSKLELEVLALREKLAEIEVQSKDVRHPFEGLKLRWEDAERILGIEGEREQWHTTYKDSLDRMDRAFTKRAEEEKNFWDELLNVRRQWEMQRGTGDPESSTAQPANRLRDIDLSPRFERDKGNIGIDDDEYNFRRMTLEMDFQHEMRMLTRRKDFRHERNHPPSRSSSRPPGRHRSRWHGGNMGRPTAGPQPPPASMPVGTGPPPPPPPRNWPQALPPPPGVPLNRSPSPPHFPIKDTKPALDRIVWADFKMIRGPESTLVPSQHFYAIDVLIGEPLIASPFMDRKVPTRLDLLPGQAPLPERIRINSVPIIRILEEIHGDDISNGLGAPVVIMRPFKALIYYEARIRDRYKKLANKYREKGGGSSKSQSEVDVADTGDTVPRATDGKPNAKESNDEEAFDCQEVGVSQSEDVSDSEKSIEDSISFSSDTSYRLRSEYALQQLQCLIDFMDTELDVKLKYLRSANCRKVTFSDVWLLFKPGDFVLGQNERQAYQVIIVTSTGHRTTSPYENYLPTTNKTTEVEEISILCVHVDFDGKAFGPVAKVFTIRRFEGERNTTSLEIYPFTFARDQNLQQKLIERGKLFLEMAAIKHMHYAGLTLETRDEVDSQVVVDFEEAFTKQRGWKPRVDQTISMRKEYGEERCIEECCRAYLIHNDSYVEKNRNEDFKDSLFPPAWTLSKMPSVAIFPRPLKESQMEENKISDSELLIMSYRVFGFLLRSRRWAKLDITYLKSIDTPTTGDGGNNNKESSERKKSRTPFDQLVIPDEHKRMVLSLIAQHFRDKESASSDDDQADIVRGKGKGLILLLHGAPGVGKTTTAECVAQLFKKPLFQITCGDLGTTAKEVEGTLERNFELANRWGCILLLDEADVFLAKRTTLDFVRNGLVAVFLRVLEYYAGILFLTTNRVGDFDEAFTSRIHISLEYKPLDEDQTRKVFRVNLDRIEERFRRNERKLTMDDNIPIYVTDYWREYPKARWNGRQIRNACQTALALAEFEAQGGQHDAIVDPDAVVNLDVKHFKLVAKAYLNFIEYLKSIYKIYADEKAAEDLIRASVESRDLPNPLTLPSKFDPLRSWVPKEQMEQFYNFQGNYHTQSQARYQQFPASNLGGAQYRMPYVQHQQATHGPSFHAQESPQVHQQLLHSNHPLSSVTPTGMYQSGHPAMTNNTQYNGMQPGPSTGGYATAIQGSHPALTRTPQYGNMHPGPTASGPATNPQGETPRQAELDITTNSNTALSVNTDWNFPQQQGGYEMNAPMANAPGGQVPPQC